MSNYTEADLPVTLQETEVVTLEDGTTVRFEENGGARDVFIGDEWTARTQLFEGCDYTLDAGGNSYVLKAGPGSLTVSKA